MSDEHTYVAENDPLWTEAMDLARPSYPGRITDEPIVTSADLLRRMLRQLASSYRTSQQDLADARAKMMERQRVLTQDQQKMILAMDLVKAELKKEQG